MLNFLQYQSKAFNQKVFESKFDQFSEAEKQAMIQKYIQEEVLYRAAINLGLEQNDFVIKRRIIQKMDFILDDFDESKIRLSEDSIQAFYQLHAERYFKPTLFTFTHIFFKEDLHNNALTRANAFMEKSLHQNLSVEKSLPYGDRFLYHRNYAEKNESLIESQFGTVFTKALTNLKADKDKWQGPISSEYGVHWLKLLKNKAGGLSDYNEIYPVVKADYLTYLKIQHKQEQIKKLLETYDVNIDL